MTINSEYKLRDVAGEKVIIRQSSNAVDMTAIISLNESAQFLWNFFQGKNFSKDDVKSALIEEYGIDGDLAAKDSADWCRKMKELNLLKD